jgi:hypothetical protein
VTKLNKAARDYLLIAGTAIVAVLWANYLQTTDCSLQPTAIDYFDTPSQMSDQLSA